MLLCLTTHTHANIRTNTYAYAYKHTCLENADYFLLTTIQYSTTILASVCVCLCLCRREPTPLLHSFSTVFCAITARFAVSTAYNEWIAEQILRLLLLLLLMVVWLSLFLLLLLLDYGGCVRLEWWWWVLHHHHIGSVGKTANGSVCDRAQMRFIEISSECFRLQWFDVTYFSSHSRTSNFQRTNISIKLLFECLAFFANNQTKSNTAGIIKHMPSARRFRSFHHHSTFVFIFIVVVCLFVVANSFFLLMSHPIMLDTVWHKL